jgi:hypothetical protein
MVEDGQRGVGLKAYYLQKAVIQWEYRLHMPAARG